MIVRLRKIIASEESGQRGVVLLLVLWVILLLGIIAAEFAYTMRTEVNIARYSLESAQAYTLAVAGVQAAIWEIYRDAEYLAMNESGQLVFGRPEPRVPGTPSAPAAEGELFPLPAPPPRTDVPLGAGTYTYYIIDEESKLNLNLIRRKEPPERPNTPYQALAKLLVETGVEEGLELETILDSIVDWRDQDSEHHLNGAEDDWYEDNYQRKGFREPYECKDGRFDTVEELLMVRGITPEIFFGTGNIPPQYQEIEAYQEDVEVEEGRSFSGIARYVTVAPTSMRVNRNTASASVIRSAFPTEAEQILSEREERGGLYNRQDSSSHFTVFSTGKVSDGEVQRTVRALIWRRGRGSNVTIAIQQWSDAARMPAYARNPQPVWGGFEEFGE